MRSAFIVFVASCGISSLAQNAQRQQPASLVERACAGESSAESELEQNADSNELKTMMHDPECQDNVCARFFLAKRGDQEALQFYACRSRADKIEVIQELMRDGLPHIGGEFAVEIYRQLLDSDERFHADLIESQKHCADCLLTPLSDTVPSGLEKLLPDVAIPRLSPLQFQGNPQAREQINSMWRSWIDSHSAELMQMKPTAEGISFNSDACSAAADLTTLEGRLKTIAGDRAAACGPDLYDSGVRESTNTCIRRAFAHGKAFYAWYVLGGSFVWNVAVGIAGDRDGNVFVISFDDAGASRAGLGEEVQVFDNGAAVVVPCPTPIKFHEAYSGNLTCIVSAGNIRLSPK